ncbi:MAG: lamin tail domain-containing protein [Patescibacteria group bacterium]|nr:lamin tail domain-containing protein [Patescibacteria group bacterium]
MKKLILAGQIIASILFLTRGFFICPKLVQSENPPQVVINELMWMGSSASSSDEWLELKNLTDQPIDLSNWYLTKKSAGAEVLMLTLPAGSALEANGFFLISNFSDESASSVLNIPPDLVDTAISLVNTSLQIKLYSANQTLIDTADDGSGQPLAGEYASGTTWKSMERNWDWADGTLETSWHTAEISYNFDLGAIEFGTPRWPNTDPNYPPIAEAGDNQTVKTNETVYFDGSDSTDPDADPLSYHWAFGDDVEADGITPTHAYAQTGEFTVTLLVSDGNKSSTDTLTVAVEDEPAPITEPEPENTPVIYSHDVRINELLPNPEGSDTEHEFIELENTGATDVDLRGWLIGDSSREYQIDPQDFPTTTIEARGYFLLNRNITGIALNNSAPETVRLKHPDNEVLEEISYQPPVPEGESYNRAPSGWVWSATLTPGQENVITIKEPDKPKEGEKDPKKEKTSLPEETKIGQNPAFDFSTRVLITELLPNPEGVEAEEEFIELANFDDKDINLSGWQLTDTKTYFKFGDSVTLGAGDYLVFLRPETKIALNNSSDQVFLIDPNKKIVSGVKYQKAEAGLSWSRRDQSNNWAWSTNVTPEQENVIELVENEDQTDPNQTAKEAREVDLSQVRGLANRDLVKTRGVVTVLPGILGKLLFYISTAEAGIQIYSSKGEFPELKLGNEIEVIGALGESQSERKINLRDIKVMGDSSMPEPLDITGQELTEDLEGRLVRIEGAVLSKKTQTIVLDSGGTEITVSLKKATGLKLADYTEGDLLTVTGIVSQLKTDYRILPRSSEDLTKAEVLGESTETVPLETPEKSIALTGDNSRRKTLIYLFSALGGLIIAGGIYYLKNKKAKSSSQPL